VIYLCLSKLLNAPFSSTPRCPLTLLIPFEVIFHADYVHNELEEDCMISAKGRKFLFLSFLMRSFRVISSGPTARARAQALTQKVVASFHFGHKEPCRHHLFAPTPTEQLWCCTYASGLDLLYPLRFFCIFVYCIVFSRVLATRSTGMGFVPSRLFLGMLLTFITSTFYDHDHEVVTVPIVWDVQIGPVAYYNYKRFLRDLFLSYLRV